MESVKRRQDLTREVVGETINERLSRSGIARLIGDLFKVPQPPMVPILL